MPPLGIVIAYVILWVLARFCCRVRVKLFSKSTYSIVGLGWFTFAIHKFIPAPVYFGIGVFIYSITYGVVVRFVGE